MTGGNESEIQSTVFSASTEYIQNPLGSFGDIAVGQVIITFLTCTYMLQTVHKRSLQFDHYHKMVSFSEITSGHYARVYCT
jgi:hypothetical protein